MGISSTSAAGLLEQTLESTVYASGSVSLDNVGTEVSYEFTDPSIKVHLVQSGDGSQSVEVTLVFKGLQIVVGTTSTTTPTAVSPAALSEYPAGVGPPRALGRPPRGHCGPGRQPLVHRRGLGGVHVLAQDPGAPALLGFARSGRLRGLRQRRRPC